MQWHSSYLTPLPQWKRVGTRERGQVMIYDRDAAFQRRMINLFWEHFTSTSLTYLGLAHTRTPSCQCVHKACEQTLAHARRAHTLHAWQSGHKCRGRVHVGAFVCNSCAVTPSTPQCAHTHTSSPLPTSILSLRLRLPCSFSHFFFSSRWPRWCYVSHSSLSSFSPSIHHEWSQMLSRTRWERKGGKKMEQKK